MEKDLLQTAALDLGIVRYSSESESQFNNRVIYSALACWIKARSFEDANIPTGERNSSIGGICLAA